MPCSPSDTVYFIIASAQAARGCEVTIAGEKFFVATIDGKRVTYISTASPEFTTPEGIRVGAKFPDIVRVRGSEIVGEVGWRYFSVLPSGWCAMYSGIPGVDTLGGIVLARDSTVVELFRRE